MKSIIKAVIITNVPAPYRIPGWQLISKMSDINLNVVFCSRSNIDITLNSDSLGFSVYYWTLNYANYLQQQKEMHGTVQLFLE